MHWWPRQTPRVGIRELNVRMISLERPDSFGEQGPGGENAAQREDQREEPVLLHSVLSLQGDRIGNNLATS